MPGPDPLDLPRSRIDPQSPLIADVDVDYQVRHAGRHSIVLRPVASVEDDVIITTADVGLMPGGLHCPPGIFEHWRGYAVGSGVPLSAEAKTLVDADRVDLRLGSMDIDLDAVRLGLELHAHVAPEGTRGSIDTARSIAHYALAREVLDLELLVLQTIGAGPGSTPSGDDVIVGVAAALACTGHASTSRMIAATACRLEDRTTRSSRLYLRAAADGRFAERVHVLARAMTGVERVSEVLVAARSWGATSGLELAGGVLGGLEIATARAGDRDRRSGR